MVSCSHLRQASYIEFHLGTDTDTFWECRAAELLDALPGDDLDTEFTASAQLVALQTDPVELRLERNELPKYLMAKAFFDCHEIHRCATVFLPTSSPEYALPTQDDLFNINNGKVPTSIFKETSQRGLFLASYALLIAGEKERMEQLNQILGPSDTGAVVNRQLAPLRHMLGIWFDEAQQESLEYRPSQGWLEYL